MFEVDWCVSMDPLVGAWKDPNCWKDRTTSKKRIDAQRHLPKNRRTMGAFFGFAGHKPVVRLVSLVDKTLLPLRI